MPRAWCFMRRAKSLPRNARAFIIQEALRNAELIEGRIAELGITEESYARSTLYQVCWLCPCFASANL